MPFIPTDAICAYAGCIILHGAFEAVAAVTEKRLMDMANDPGFADWFGDAVDPLFELRGLDVGRQESNICKRTLS